MNIRRINYILGLLLTIISCLAMACLEDRELDNQHSVTHWVNINCSDSFQVTALSDNTEIFLDCSEFGGCNIENGYCTNPDSMSDSCSGNATICKNDKMYICHHEIWLLAQTCSDGCDQAELQCGPLSQLTSAKCTIGATKCENDNIWMCNGLGMWTVLESCEGRGCDGTECSENSSSQQEVKKECVIGEFKCENDFQYLCNVNGAWEQTKSCENLGCNGKLCAEAATKCQLGNKKCEDDTQYLCGMDGTWEKTKSCNGLGCADKICAENPTEDECQPGNYKCEINTQYICSENGTWNVDKSCLECVENVCITEQSPDEKDDKCIKNSTKCENNGEYICQSDGTWTLKYLCFSGCNADENKCND